MDNAANRAVRAVRDGRLAYCKFLTANDTGDTGAHQAGIHIAKNAFAILFDAPGVKGSINDSRVEVRWQDR
jgi:type II restriction enzyme